MKPKELLRLVWINITQNKFKVVMTSIGIIVGAATIVMVIAIGKGGQADSLPYGSPISEHAVSYATVSSNCELYRFA